MGEIGILTLFSLHVMNECKFCHCKYFVCHLCHAANDLDKGKEYEFRVKAKNAAGLGEPSSPSNAVVTKPKASEC